MCDEARILVIDDEWIIVDSIQYALELKGYVVDAVLSGDDASEHLATNRSGYAAIITDIDLGQGIDGWSLASIAREVVPNIAVIYCTSQPAHVWQLRGLVGSRLVPKPFTQRDLAQALEELIQCGQEFGKGGSETIMSAAA
jgi:CheY-like chemotaxis protein